MFERYTEKARRVIFFSRYEASHFGSPSIETEHLLLGLLREDKELTARFLRSQTVIEAIRKQIDEATLKREDSLSSAAKTSVDLPLSNECRKVLADAAEEAERLSDKHIGPEHFLLGLLRQESSFAAALLHERGVRLSMVREQLRNSIAVRISPSALKLAVPETSASTLTDLGIDLTAKAFEGQLPPLIGREPEMERLIQVLCRHSGNSAVLVGEPGIGKKTLVYGLAQRMVESIVPAALANVSIAALDLEVIAAGTSSQQQFVAELMHGAGYVVFLDGLHGLAGAGRCLQMLSLMRTGLLQGYLRCISTATAEEYEKAIEQESWLKRCFQPVPISPPDEKETIRILAGIKQRLERFHGVAYSDEAIQYAVYHAASYIRGGQLPEKALDVMDEAAVLVTLRSAPDPEPIRAVRKELQAAIEREANAIAGHEAEKARYYADERRKQERALKALRDKYSMRATPIVNRSDIDSVVARWTGLRLEAISKSRHQGKP